MIYFDNYVFDSVDADTIKVEFDNKDCDRKLPFKLELDIAVVEQDFNEENPEKDFYLLKKERRDEWCKWIINYVKKDIMSYSQTLEAMEESKNKYKAFYHQSQEYISKRDLKIAQLEMELKELRGSVMTITRESALNFKLNSNETASVRRQYQVEELRNKLLKTSKQA